MATTEADWTRYVAHLQEARERQAAYYDYDVNRYWRAVAEGAERDLATMTRYSDAECLGWRIGQTYLVDGTRDTVIGCIHYLDWRGDTVQVLRHDPYGTPMRYVEHSTHRAICGRNVPTAWTA